MTKQWQNVQSTLKSESLWPRRSRVQVPFTTPVYFKPKHLIFKQLRMNFWPILHTSVFFPFCWFSLILGVPITQNLPKIYSTKIKSQATTRRPNQLSYDHHDISERLLTRWIFQQHDDLSLGDFLFWCRKFILFAGLFPAHWNELPHCAALGSNAYSAVS